MSEIKNTSPVWAPPIFPEQGRLPTSETTVYNNYKKQRREEDEYLQKYNESTSRRNGFVCSQSLHINLFFDGTGNNNKQDTELADPKHPTNIAKLFHAAYPPSAEEQGYFSYYMPGVGTPFPEIGEMDYSGDGLMFASGGEDRINWALMMLVDALSYTLTAPAHKRLATSDAKAKVKAMSTSMYLGGIEGKLNRKREFLSAINELGLNSLVETHNPKLLKIKLFVYGFSRGAAEARTFVNWLTELLETPEGEKLPQQSLLGIPLSIEFLGLLDTVPSVGVAHIAPLCDGHMGWASGTQQLPNESKYPNLIKCCYHFAAAHEQRLCFPMDSVRRPEGDYPAFTKEVLYPGMHSDIGGGYPAGDPNTKLTSDPTKAQPGDQGKGREGVGSLLSQIILHDIYAAALGAGAPLTVPEDVIPDALKAKQPSRKMSSDSILEFDVSPELAERFNAWRTTLLPAADLAEPAEQVTSGYHPHPLSQSLEDAVAVQIGWITAWRIGRYAHRGYLQQPFYNQAIQSSPGQLALDELSHDEKQKKIAKDRITAAQNPKAPGAQDMLNKQGVPDYDPDIAQQELREAAEEFRSDYYDEMRPQEGAEFYFQTVPKHVIYLIHTDDERTEYREIKADGDRLYPVLFSGQNGTDTTDPRLAKVLALYDDQIHDSRAWFMYSTLGTREPWGSYFFYRSIYCGSASNKDQYLFAVAGKLIGAATAVGGVIYSVKRKNLKGIAGGLAGTAGAYVLERTITDAVTGAPIPMLDNAAELFKPSKDSGALIAQTQQQVVDSQHQQSMKSMMDYLESVGSELV
ncbi:DUF2235 domain-containing protein [Serratia marcescens]|uniref:T6SS phospholipase effector Tle1-like catalytic domain-containing protein n=1 Tax=Serratia marcescens TaxID=615 RepID=UPI0024C4DC81|nr:DUF2235 domain-containing protein [Serratia marcescens]MDK1711592.1 DUF2235 domain-containing protein [Serratia marcescens]